MQGIASRGRFAGAAFPGDNGSTAGRKSASDTAVTSVAGSTNGLRATISPFDFDQASATLSGPGIFASGLEVASESTGSPPVNDAFSRAQETFTRCTWPIPFFALGCRPH